MLYLKTSHRFITEPLEDKELRTQLKAQGIDARRMSRFTQLALLGALPLKAQIPAQTSLYIASPFSSPSKFNKMFGQLMNDNLPSPLDFMANLNNAATFQIAQHFNLQQTSLFLAIHPQDYLQPLYLAELDLTLEPEKSALIGWVLESPNREGIEGSVWWLVNTTKNQESSLITKESFDFCEVHLLLNNANFV
ncbi:hypothetical protein [Conservatibacter flavescens]|uniref:hypothetical protein n=1 Tax=Conservatibacter flavescens TaxID=28161 RepID=UPI001A9C92D2|nr:hypothetical protein [Conservatibacter flavescens]